MENLGKKRKKTNTTPCWPVGGLKRVVLVVLVDVFLGPFLDL